VSDDHAVVIEHPAPVLRDFIASEPVRVLLELVQVDVDALKRQAFLDERNMDFSEFAAGSAW